MADLGSGGGYFLVAYALFLGGVAGYTIWLWTRLRQARGELERHRKSP